MKFEGNVMVFGPPMSGKVILARNLMLQDIREECDGIYVTANDTAEDVLDWFKEFGVEVKIIDCISKSVDPDLKDSEDIKRCSSPIDLTCVSATLSRFLGDNYRKEKKSVIVFDTISTFLMYTNLQTVYRFLHFTTRRIKSMNAKALYIVQEGMHDERTIATLKQIFNGVIEVKCNDKRFLRFVSPFHKTDWVEFKIDGKRVII